MGDIAWWSCGSIACIKDVSTRFGIGESAFYSLSDAAKYYVPLYPSDALIGNSFNTSKHLNRVNCPVIVIHSKTDETVPIDHGRRLYEVAKAPKVFIKIEGYHNSVFFNSRSIICSEFNKFLKVH
jgi:uncharacterized protein